MSISSRQDHFYRILILVVCAVLLMGSVVFSKEEDTHEEIVVKFKSHISEEVKTRVRNIHGAVYSDKIEKIRAEILKVKKNNRGRVIEELTKSGLVEYAEPNHIATISAITNDLSLASQWGMFAIDAADSTGLSGWNIATGDAGVRIAILDTGMSTKHPDLVGKIVVSRNFSSSKTITDRNGHGSHVAGIAAAATNNARGVAGVGYNTSLMNVKVLGDNGSGFYSWIANGIIWAADNGADVINMSLGGASGSQVLLDAVNYAWNKGVLLVAAAGNGGVSSLSYPAAYEPIIAVAATTKTDTKPSWSNYGSWVDVAAPGLEIYSTYRGTSYATLSGTSMASPFVAGLAGLIWGQGICTTNTCVRNAIETTADPVAGTGIYWTYGRINAYKALGGL